MLSKLWNVSLDVELKRLKRRLLEFLQQKLKHGTFSLEADNGGCMRPFMICIALKLTFVLA